jgi:hypothetical protein
VLVSQLGSRVVEVVDVGPTVVVVAGSAVVVPGPAVVVVGAPVVVVGAAVVDGQAVPVTQTPSQTIWPISQQRPLTSQTLPSASEQHSGKPDTGAAGSGQQKS